MRFFFDRSMPIRIARMVAAYETEHTIRHLDDDARFADSTPDMEWMRTIAADTPPWIVISADFGILRNKAERAVLPESGLTFFCFNKAWAKHDNP
jgi:hypothetical protein